MNTKFSVFIRDRRIDHAQIQAIAKSGLFDPVWYKNQYLCPIDTEDNSFGHFIARGIYEGNDPGPRFRSKDYVSLNKNLDAREANPLLHYIAMALCRQTDKRAENYSI